MRAYELMVILDGELEDQVAQGWVKTIAEGIGIYDKDPAVGIVRAKLGEFLPLVGTGEMTAQEALDAAAAAYVEEATAQGYIQ